MLVAAAGFCVHVWRAARSAEVSGSLAAQSFGVASTSISTLQPSETPFESAGLAPEFRSAAEFEGDFYVCGTAALFRYSSGQLARIFYAGRELPATRLRSVIVRKGIPKPELWIATDDGGVLIYDGKTFRQLLPRKPEARRISALLPLSNGSVLVGTQEAGLYLSDGKSLRIFHPQFSKTAVTALAGDQDEFWVGTRADGAWHWRGGGADHVTADLPDPQVLSVAIAAHRAWIGTALGVVEFSGGKPSRHLADGLFAQSLAENSGKLWIGTMDQGTFALPLDTAKARPQLTSAAQDSLPTVSFVHIGPSLAAVQPRLIVELSGELPLGQPLITPLRNTIAANHISAVHEDSQGRLWIGYFDRGIDVLPGSASGHPTHFEDDVVFCVNRIKEDSQDGSVLAATANGLVVFDSAAKLRQILTRANGLISSNVTDALVEPSVADGPAWVVATPAGISFLQHGSASSMYAFQGLVNNHVYTLADRDGTLYVGTLGGVSTVQNGRVQASYNTANSPLRQNWITASALFENHLYLGTYGSGVIRFDDGESSLSFPQFGHQRTEINPNALAASHGALYAGTAGQGLAILRAGDQHWQFITAGLPSLNVTALDIHAGRLYIGTDNGLVRIGENTLLP
jgi:ligand-binding sensor domain-containing protein